jgi:DNA replication and repair protein RecF
MKSLFINKLKLINFKNYADAQLTFSEKINCFTGNNGVGKTNLLDALHYLSFTKSYFNPIDSQNIKHHEDFFMIEADVTRNGSPEHLLMSVQKGQKKILKRNQKEYQKMSEHIGFMPVVMISPYDRDLIMEGSDVRRKFIDQLISFTDVLYLEDLMAYNKILAQRNALLKYFASNRTFDEASLSIYDQQLTDKGVGLYEKRKQNLELLRPRLLHFYKAISNHSDAVDLEFHSHLHETDFLNLLAARREKDRVLQYTSGGIHKDDLEFTLDGFPLKKTGSQGQQKTFLIALKLAQFEFLRDKTGYKPLLLLDDIFDKLDASRVNALIELVNANQFGQIFITDTHPERTGEIVRQINGDAKIFKVSPETIAVNP